MGNRRYDPDFKREASAWLWKRAYDNPENYEQLTGHSLEAVCHRLSSRLPRLLKAHIGVFFKNADRLLAVHPETVTPCVFSRLGDMKIQPLTIRQLVRLGLRFCLADLNSGEFGFREGGANNAAGTLFILSDTRSYTHFM